MLKRIFRLFRNRRNRAKLIHTIKKATAQGQCVILGDVPEGTRVIILGRGTYQTQLEEIAKSKGVRL
uniref:Uncharacterized protein n=1 Tax=viral metagenome TaxID=1070528 RepID=A0A6H2A409_9ZZZZ